jgi:hypothetical protein
MIAMSVALRPAMMTEGRVGTTTGATMIDVMMTGGMRIAGTTIGATMTVVTMIVATMTAVIR